MEQDDDFCIEDEVLGGESGEESVGESSCPAQKTGMQQIRKR